MHCRPGRRSLVMFRSKRSSGSGAGSPVPPRARPSLAAPSNGFGNSHGSDPRGAWGGDAPPSPALVQRLIILHDGLAPDRRGGGQQTRRRRNPQLSEDASLAEHGEHILYYYDRSLHERGRGDASLQDRTRRGSSASDVSANSCGGRERLPADHATKEAVQFAGVCRALRSLPLALQPEMRDEGGDGNGEVEGEFSEAEVIHLRDSTLVFVPLELGGTIVAAAQVPRAKPIKKMPGTHGKRSASTGYGADPAAMRGTIRHVHAAFSLLFGGGIHGRLLRTRRAESSSSWVLEVVGEDGEKEGAEKEYKDDGSASSDVPCNLKTKDEAGKDEPGNDEVKSEAKLESKPEVANGGQAEPVEPRRNSAHARSRRGFRKLSRSFSGSADQAVLLRNPRRLSGEEVLGGVPEGVPANSPGGDGPSAADYRYGGMEELLSLRREQTKLARELRDDVPAPRFNGLTSARSARWKSSANAEDLFSDIANDYGHDDCQRRIDNLLAVLPITTLRKDLVKYYDEWLGRVQGLCDATRGGVGRCVVDMVPAPLLAGLAGGGPVRGQYPPQAPVPFVCLAAGEFVGSLMREEVPKVKGFRGRLVGTSMFYQNRLVLSEVLGNRPGRAHVALPPEVAYTIADHFHCHEKRRIKVAKLSGNGAAEQGQDSSVRPGLIKMMSGLSVAAIKDEAVSDSNRQSLHTWDENGAAHVVDTSPGYKSFPPSLADPDRPAEAVFVRNLNKHVWLPRVHLPSESSLDSTGDDEEAEIYAAMFHRVELSFILIFELPSSVGDESAVARMAEELKPRSRRVSTKPAGNETQAFADALTFVADRLMDFCNTYSSREPDPRSDNMSTAPIKEINSHGVFPGEVGMDIVCVDRDESSFVLLSHHDLSSDEYRRAVPDDDDSGAPANGPKFGLFGMGGRLKEGDEKASSRALRYASMLDCRHKLAAYLPLDVMLAFDDMFRELGRRSRCRRDTPPLATGDADVQDNDSGRGGRSIEMCTFLPQGWVYGRASGGVELYVLLDTGKFVTINDVQKAVTRVRERIFNDRIR